MAFKATPAQQQAIETHGNILVSAAAGSGKTAVLVERVISRLCSETDGISADKLLIVTFTNAAAAEMRTRIEKRLDEIILKNPNKPSLILQKHLLSSAKICTIDSFCIDLVRENFEKVGVSPDFKISDSAALIATDRRVLTNIINEYLENKNPEFLKLLDIIGAEFDEQNFMDFIFKIYNFSSQLPFPKKWFNKLNFPYTRPFGKDNEWYQYAFEIAKNELQGVITALENALELISVSEKAYNGYYLVFSTVIDRLTKLLTIANFSDWDKFYNSLLELNIPDLPRVNGISGIPEVASAKIIYKELLVKSISKLEAIFYADSEFITKQFEFLAGPFKLLSEILIRYNDDLFKEYTKINSFTFHNTEHLALNLLCEESKNDDILIKDTAIELLSRFEEIMVDEYQDTNDLQDMLFYVLSNRESKLFVVGDIKQSIYGFRGANPENFLLKKNRYIPIDNASDIQPKKIVLANNFRSKPEICEYINFFFELFMTNETGKINYDLEERLIPAASFEKTDMPSTEIHIVSKNSSSFSADVLEAREIATIIKNTLSSGNVIKDNNNSLRPAKYSDFTILLRSARIKAPIFANELINLGIPVSYNSEEYLETTEISTFLSLLKVIDNPKSDIDLLTVMMSPIFSFTADEMAKFRINDRKGDIYTTVITAANSGNKRAELFLKTLNSYRLLAITNTLPKLITELLNETGYCDIVSAMQDGIKRKNNLLLLSHYAEEFSNGSNLTVSAFLKQLEKLGIGLKSATTNTDGNSVKIMSIHASKGLQFPVCIIAGTASSFNDNEARESTIYSVKQGLGIKYFDEEEKTKLTTVGRELILERTRSERLEEELRLLYVAMTRAQDKLIFTGTVSDVYKKAETLKSLLLSFNCRITNTLFSKTTSYLDWIFLSTLLHPNGKQLRGEGTSIFVKEATCEFSLYLPYGEELTEEVNSITSHIPDVDICVAEKISEAISFTYPYSDLLEVESKVSVSFLAKGDNSDEFAFSARPEFMNEGGLSASQKGTAMHKVMQFFDFSKWNDVDNELERLYEWQFLSEAEYNCVDKNLLNRFFKSSLFKRILNSKSVNREMRFLTELPATKIAPELNNKYLDEMIVVQGAIDVCFEENGELVILDFKTDRVNDINILAERYSEQLKIYSLAAQKIFNKRVKENIIYSFYLSEQIVL